MLGVGIVAVRAEFEACRRDCMSSSPVRAFESGLEQFEPSSRRVDGIKGFRAQLEACRQDCRSSSPVRGL